MRDRARDIERVRKLMSLANDASAGPGEIANAMAQARVLMDRHNLSSVDVEEVVEEQEITEVRCGDRSRLDPHERDLAVAIARWTDTEVFVCRNGWGRQFHAFIGRKCDAELAAAILPAMLATARSSARRSHGQKWSNTHSEHVVGFAMAIVSRTQSARKHAAEPGRTEIVLRDRKAAIEDYIEEHVGDCGSRHGTKSIEHPDAFIAGKRSGEGVVVGPQVGGPA